jgi:hypothetical protein
MAKQQAGPHTTRWSLIVRAQGSGRETRAALGELIGRYERFVLWLIRQHGHPPDLSAEELKQEFMEGIVRRNDIAKLDRARGSFRGWLSLAVKRFLSNEWAKWRAASAGRKDTAPTTFELTEPSAPAEDACTREFAGHVVVHTLALQRSEARDAQRFDALARFLPGPQLDIAPLAPLARSLGLTQTALAKAICLLRARYRELLRDSIRDLLEPTEETEAATESAIDEELRELRRHFWS